MSLSFSTHLIHKHIYYRLSKKNLIKNIPNLINEKIQ